jgi:hypothetical protein
VKLIYLAAPYSLGDQALNVRSQIRNFSELLDEGIVIPYAPLLTHFVHMLHPKSYDAWLSHCLNMLARMDAVLLLPAIEESVDYRQEESKGVQIELAFCAANKIPVFRNKETLYNWVTQTSTEGSE